MSAELNRVREYRRAARVAVRADDAELGNRYLALVDLAECARREPDPLVRLWGERAIWEESKLFLGVDAEEPEPPPAPPFETRQRELRREGYERCPKCLSVLSTEVDWDRWRRMREAHVEDLRRREQAVDDR